jgi:hypothetical protein
VFWNTLREFHASNRRPQNIKTVNSTRFLAGRFWFPPYILKHNTLIIIAHVTIYNIIWRRNALKYILDTKQQCVASPRLEPAKYLVQGLWNNRRSQQFHKIFYYAPSTIATCFGYLLLAIFRRFSHNTKYQNRSYCFDIWLVDSRNMSRLYRERDEISCEVVANDGYFINLDGTRNRMHNPTINISLYSNGSVVWTVILFNIL